jgi:hypothetical protein
MTKVIIVAILTLSILIGLFMTNQYIEADRAYSKREVHRQLEQATHLGEKVVIDGDTLTIINTNFWNEFILSDGRKLSGCYFINKKNKQ